MDDSKLPVDVALLESEQLRWPESGRGREDHHRPVHQPELRGHGFDLPPCFERSLLLRPPRRVWDAALGGVVVEQPPGDSAVENLPQCLRRLEAVSSGTLNRHPYTSRGDRSASRFSPVRRSLWRAANAAWRSSPARP